MKSKVNEELKHHFRPEFLNRVDDTIVFHQLTEDEIVTIVDLMIAKVDERLRDRDMGLELRPDAKALLAVRGYDPVLGARPLRRTIQRSIEDALSEKILFGELKAGQIVIVDVGGYRRGGRSSRSRACPSRTPCRMPCLKRWAAVLLRSSAGPPRRPRTNLHRHPIARTRSGGPLPGAAAPRISPSGGRGSSSGRSARAGRRGPPQAGARRAGVRRAAASGGPGGSSPGLELRSGQREPSVRQRVHQAVRHQAIQGPVALQLICPGGLELRAWHRPRAVAEHGQQPPAALPVGALVLLAAPWAADPRGARPGATRSGPPPGS